MKTKFEQLFDNADQMAPDINAVYEAGMELVNNYRWISVKERAPDSKTYVDVWSIGERFTDVQYTKTHGFREYGQYPIDCVTHWMPLPEPPEEGE